MAAQSDSNSQQYVAGGLYGSRHQQLTLLRQIKLPSKKAHNRPVRGATAKNVLKAIDATINKNASYWIPISDLVESTGLSESTVSSAVAVLKELVIIDVTHRYEVRGNKRKQLPSRFRIIWSNLPDFVPAKVVEDEPLPVIVEGDEPTQPPLSMSPPGPQSEGGVASVGKGGGLSLRGGGSQTEGRTSPTSPHFSNPSPDNAASPKTDEEGKDLFWQQAVKEPDQLRRAVKKRDVTWLQLAWSEAVAAGWQVDTRDGFRRFLAAARYVTHPPDGFLIENPARVLRQKLIENDWKTGRMDGADDDWATTTLQAIEHPEPVPRTGNLMNGERVRDRDSEIQKLRAFAAQQAKGNS